MFSEAAEVVELSEYLQRGSIRTIVDMPGRIKCIVCNGLGCDSTEKELIVRDVTFEPGIPMKLISVNAFLLLMLVLLLIYSCERRHRIQAMRKQLEGTGLLNFQEGAPNSINPQLMVTDQAELLPYDREWEFPRDRLKLGKKLGSGFFGTVIKAEALGIVPHEAVTTVAVKMVHRNHESAHIRALVSELKIMVHLGKHLNIVNLLGSCTKNIDKRDLLVIVEFCRFGNLHDYLLRHRKNFIDQLQVAAGEFGPTLDQELSCESSNTAVEGSFGSTEVTITSDSYNSDDTVTYCADNVRVTTPSRNSLDKGEGECIAWWRHDYQSDCQSDTTEPLRTQDLLSWAFQIARGMEYLSQRKVLHGDLAARNILLSDYNVVKICDFGLAKKMGNHYHYLKTGDEPVPIKWMAIESITDRVFSTKSDIWSFGIVLWEFFTLAKAPYPGLQAENLIQKLKQGYRMEKPKYAPKNVYTLMLSCWETEPSLRPSFTQLVQDIGEFLEESVKMHYVKLNEPYVVMNKLSQESKSDYLQLMADPDQAFPTPSHPIHLDQLEKITRFAVREYGQLSQQTCGNDSGEDEAVMP